MPETVKVTGLKELIETLQNTLPETARKAATRAIRKGGNLMKNALIQATPESTTAPAGSEGFMKHGWKTRFRWNKGDPRVTIAIGKNLQYPKPLHRRSGRHSSHTTGHVATIARMVELGTKTRPEHSFAGPAFDSNVTEVYDMIKSELQEAIAKAGK